MTTDTFDAAIIGTGQAGPSLANRLTQAGWKVAVFERGRFGGTCVNNGCMPTKTMVASAYAAHMARRAEDYGVEIAGPITVDMKKVKARKDRVSDTASANIETWLKSMPGCTIFRGHARLVSPRAIVCGETRIKADKIFLNVGGRAIVPSIPGISKIPFLTNETMMDLDMLPPHLIVLGGSYVGLEFAQCFRRFGSQVTIIEAAPRLVPREDADVSEAIREILVRECIDVRLGSKATGAVQENDGVRLSVDTAGEPTEIAGSHLLLAIGRRPNTDDLGLQAAGIEIDKAGYVKTDEELQTNVRDIWALGDCNGRGAFTHTSYNDYEIVAANLLDGDRRRASDRILTYGVFIDPPLGRIGMTERDALAAGHSILVGTRPMSRVGRAVEKGETLGFMKVIVDGDSKKILGAAILGTSGDEAIHAITATMYADVPYTVLSRSVLIHPTVSELIPTVLQSLAPVTTHGAAESRV
ncbi:MAG: FAD-containing oxidoreductase [Proteobacteria bacterium]|nr:FAD-containing oxidoreductase [Pseudomonadota bacterium]